MTAPWHLTAAEMDAAWDAREARLAEAEGRTREALDALADAQQESERLRNKLNTDSQAFQVECQKAEIEMLRSRLADIESQNRVMWDVANDREARLAEAEAALSLASQAIDERLSGLAGDPLQPVADEINRYFAPDSASHRENERG